MRRAFTWLEFIVVLVIIVILAAILFPVLGRAPHGGARRPKCQSNLKQIGLGFIQYVQDYNGRFPPASIGNGQGWANSLQPYLKSWSLFRCPSAKSVEGETTDYFYNRRVARLEDAKFESTYNTILLGECLPNSPTNISLLSLPDSWVKGSASPVKRHLDGGNFAFADGHVKWFQPYKAVTQSPKQSDVYTFLPR